MNKQNKKTNVALQNIVNRLVNYEYDGWPPFCSTILYQPKRPTKSTPKGNKLTPRPQG